MTESWPVLRQQGGPRSVRVAAVVPAAGRGLRLGAGIPKAMVELRGVTLLRRSVEALLASEVVDLVVVVAPPELVAALVVPDGVVVVPGGAERTDSVRAGLAELDRVAPGTEHVLVHDAARALTPVELVRAVVVCLRAGADAVVPVVAVTDTIKLVTDDGLVTATPDRTRLRAVQTPQGFDAAVLRRAYRAAATSRQSATDDAGLVERTGTEVHTVPGDPLAFKITTRHDVLLAEALLVGSA